MDCTELRCGNIQHDQPYSGLKIRNAQQISTYPNPSSIKDAGSYVHDDQGLGDGGKSRNDLAKIKTPEIMMMMEESLSLLVDMSTSTLTHTSVVTGRLQIPSETAFGTNDVPAEEAARQIDVSTVSAIPFSTLRETQSEQRAGSGISMSMVRVGFGVIFALASILAIAIAVVILRRKIYIRKLRRESGSDFGIPIRRGSVQRSIQQSTDTPEPADKSSGGSAECGGEVEEQSYIHHQIPELKFPDRSSSTSWVGRVG
jgi:hypothetical protein